jgi:hypothetical protein
MIVPRKVLTLYGIINYLGVNSLDKSHLGDIMKMKSRW